MSLNKVLESYVSTPGAELELRMKLDSPAAAQRVIATFSDAATTIEQSIDFIAPSGRGNKIYKLSFVNGIRTAETYTAKEPLYAHHFGAAAPFKLSAAAESAAPKFDIAMCKIARIKLRYSVRPIPAWRIDITLVRTIHNIKSDLKAAKGAMLFPIDIDSFVAKAPWAAATSIELEAEHVDTKNKRITAAQIDTVIEAIMAALQPGHRDAAKAQGIIYRAAQFIYAGSGRAEHFRTAGMLGLYNRVIELNRATYYTDVFPNIADYLLLDKADGKRTFGMIAGGTIQFVNHTYREHQLSAAAPPGVTIFDAECVGDKYYVFDVIAFAGENLSARPTSERVRRIAAICAAAPDILIPKRIIQLGENFAKQIAATWAAGAAGDVPYEIDGLIFTQAAAPYRAMKSYKWKPLSHMSLDFLVRRPPAKLLGTPPYLERPEHELYLLFCGIRRDMYDRLRLRIIDGYAELFPGISLNRYFPIQFAPSNSPYAYLYYHPAGGAAIDNTVCEFKQIAAAEAGAAGGAEGLRPTSAVRPVAWSMIRQRTDRQADLERGGYYGNDFYTAEYTWQIYQSPLTIDDLTISSAEFIDMGYFSESKREEYKFMAGFNSYVKTMLMAPYAGRDWLVDLAAGTGQDMFRVSELKIRNALFVDRDARGLGEIVSKRAAHQRGFKQQLHTAMYTKLADLTAPAAEILDDFRAIGIPVGEIDVAMCNFAIHYLAGTAETIRNLGTLIRALLRPGGEFFFTAFDGARVFELLRGGGEGKWERRIGDTLQYSIARKYGAAAELAEAGQSIDVLLPFSAGRPRAEYLVNYDFVAAEFAAAGLNVKSRHSFAEFLPGFEAANHRGFAGMSAADKEYVVLHGAIVFVAGPRPL